VTPTGEVRERPRVGVGLGQEPPVRDHAGEEPDAAAVLLILMALVVLRS
jgi:hypothetical protein